MENFPPNSKRAREREPVQRVTSADAVRRKPSLGKQFARTFFTGDARTTGSYMVEHVVLPGIRDLMFESLYAGLEHVFKPTRRRSAPNPYGNVHYNAYNRMSQHDDRPPMPNRKMLSREARARHNFDEIILASRPDAEEVLDRLYDIISRYEEVSVADLYELTGLTSTHTDKTWGWTDLRGASVGRVRGGGYLLELPDPEPLR